MSRLTPERWRRAVYRHSQVTNATRVALLYLADYATPDAKVSVPRSQIAEALGVRPQRVTERLTEAKALGFLDDVVRGQPGRTAVYALLVPADSGDGKKVGKRSRKRAPDGTPVRTMQREVHGPPSRTKQWHTRPDQVEAEIHAQHGTPVQVANNHNEPAVEPSDDQAKNGRRGHCRICAVPDVDLDDTLRCERCSADNVDHCIDCGGREPVDRHKRCADCSPGEAVAS